MGKFGLIDEWFNDYYLSFVYLSASLWTQPTHIVFLGDLLGSQHIKNLVLKVFNVGVF